MRPDRLGSKRSGLKRIRNARWKMAHTKSTPEHKQVGDQFQQSGCRQRRLCHQWPRLGGNDESLFILKGAEQRKRVAADLEAIADLATSGCSFAHSAEG
ncbi:hypothetical protein MPLB_2300004 [Mesorhizobium sp. ORS 3324]|nr:hypothetical protein MPLB_2300004 [Mesorhizobium sp. ORS 3324]